MHITYKNHRIELTLQPQVSKSGRPFRCSGTSLVLNKPKIWHDDMWQHGTIYSFKFLDQQNDYFYLEYCPKGLFIGKN